MESQIPNRNGLPGEEAQDEHFPRWWVKEVTNK